MEDNTHEIFSEAIGELLSLQIDIKIEIKNTGNLKKAETIPKTVLDAISTITQYYSRNPQFEAKAGLIKALDIVLKIFLKNSLQGNNEITVFMEHILAIPRHGLGNDYDNWRTTENIAWMLHKCVEIYISDSQANLLLSFCLAKLNELKSQVHDSGVIENEFASKRSTDPLIEIQVILLLRTLEYLFSRVTPERDFPKYGDGIYRPILTYLSSGRISKTASRALGTLTYKFPSIHFQLMSLLLTYTTIAHAQLAGLKPEQCSRESFQDCMNSLLGNSLALATIIKCLPLCNRGIPSEISSTVLNTVKAMISGEYQGDVIEDENVFKDDGISQEIDNVKREAG